MAAGVKTKGRKANSTIKVEEEDAKELLPLESPLSSAPSSSRDMVKGEEGAPSVATPATSPTKAKGKSKAQKPVPTTLATPHPAPENWEEVYMLIRQMRSKIVAPVDTMGCDQAQFKESDPKVSRTARIWTSVMGNL
jgi:endonuclease-3